MKITKNLNALSLQEKVFVFLSIIHPDGERGAEKVFDEYDLFEEYNEQGKPDNWLFHLYMTDEMDCEGDCVLYVFYSDYIQLDEKIDDSELIIRDMQSMAQARRCKIDWGCDVSERGVRLNLGVDGLLTAAGRSLAAQGYSLWRNKSENAMEGANRVMEYSGWISKSKDSEQLRKLCILLDIAVEKLA